MLGKRIDMGTSEYALEPTVQLWTSTPKKSAREQLRKKNKKTYTMTLHPALQKNSTLNSHFDRGCD